MHRSRGISIVVALVALVVGLGVAGAGASGAAPPSGSADLSVVKKDSPDPVQAGAALAYTIDVNNAGPNSATNVVATDALPKGVSFVSASSTRGGCSASNLTVTCNLGTLGTGTYTAAAEITIDVKAPTSAGKITDTARVSADQKDPKKGNNKDSETTTVIGGTKPTGLRCHDRRVTIPGTSGDDVLTGTPHSDVVKSGPGNDQVSTAGGRDSVCAGRGSDIVAGGADKDLLSGASGRDRLRGGGADDSINGGHGRDVVRGGHGDDTIDGGPGRDKCIGGAGHDTFRGCEVIRH